MAFVLLALVVRELLVSSGLEDQDLGSLLVLEVRHHRFYVGLSQLLVLFGELELLFHDLHLYFLSLFEVSALSCCFLLILKVI